MRWTKQKPVLDRECILVTASQFSIDEWTLHIFEIKEVIINTEEYGGAYYAVLEEGEEW